VKRRAFVTCHVERPLDDACWSRFAALQEKRPGGFPIAALVRPPDRSGGEDGRRWLERAREAAGRGPLGHHTHFVSAEHARPAEPGPEHGERVRREGAWLREEGLSPSLFCGGGWYVDAGVAEAVAELGYADCTATAFRPAYLAPGAPRIALDAPAWLVLASGVRLLEIPSTHTLGMAARASLSPGLDDELVHVYFHDTDLLSPTRRIALLTALTALGRRREPTTVEALHDVVAREVAFGAASSM